MHQFGALVNAPIWCAGQCTNLVRWTRARSAGLLV
jgi:hypothetical protein